jgi:epoxyqueuosine reductase
MKKVNEEIKSILEPYYLDYIGFADLRPYQEELVKMGGPITRGYPGAISLGIAIPDSMVDYLPDQNDINIACEYRIHGYDVPNQRLNMIASMVSSYLNRQGFRTLPIAVAETTDVDNALPTISHKMVAHIAGLGWIGKNCLLVTPEHGPRLRLITILTEAPLDTVDNRLEQKCNNCNECVKICPVGAIKGKNYQDGEEREERFDFMKCRNYFDELKQIKKYAVCGLCLYVCPYGKNHINSDDKRFKNKNVDIL